MRSRLGFSNYQSITITWGSSSKSIAPHQPPIQLEIDDSSKIPPEIPPRQSLLRLTSGYALAMSRALLLGLGLLVAWGMAAPAPLGRVFVIVLENHSFQQVIGNPNLPNFNRLAKTYGLATHYYGVAHPSLPNYVALIAGDTFGSHSDNPAQRFQGPTLAGQLEAKGLSWRAYLETLPAAGFSGAYGGNPVLYAKKHNPFLLFPAIAADPALRDKVVGLEALGPDLQNNRLPTLAFIVPNLCHDLHGAPSCPSGPALDQAGDAFLGQLVQSIMASKAWAGNAAIILTFDEGEGGTAPSPLEVGGRVATVVIARQGARGRVSSTPYNHYSLLRTLEDGWGLAPLGHAAQARPMLEFFAP